MSDTLFFNKYVVKGHTMSTWLYVINSFCIAAGPMFIDMGAEKWSSYWWMQKLGFFLLVVANCTNTLKAATSSSTRPPEAA